VLLISGLVYKIRETLFYGGLPVADAFRMKVLAGELLVICVDSNLDPFEKTTVFFESLETRQ
jgi:hypothetical protein